MAKRKKRKSSIFSRRREEETSPTKEEKRKTDPLLEEMNKNERIRFQYYMKGRQEMRAQGQLLRAHWQKVDRIMGRVPVKEN